MIRFFALIAFVASLARAVIADPGGPILITAEQRRALGIVVESVESRELVARPRLPGRVILPNANVSFVTARSSGVLIAPRVAVGDAVTVGQELARLESAAFVSLQREYLEALSQLDLARSTAKREEQLAREGIIAGRRATESAAVVRDASARLEERKQALLLSGMSGRELDSLARTRKLHPDLILRALLSGVVLDQFAQAGERLDAGGAVYRIGDVDALMVDIHTPLDVAHSLTLGTHFTLPEQAARGRVVAIGSEVHTLDQGVLVRGEIEEGASLLRPGQFVQARFETTREYGSAFAVPSTAVVHVRGRTWVFRQVGAGFEPVSVEILGGSGREAVIVGPFGDGAVLAVRGTAALKAYWLASGGPG